MGALGFRNSSSWLRRALPWLTVALLLALAYDGWTFYNRWSYRRSAEKAEQANQARENRRILDALGGDHLKILAFYAPLSIRRGQSATACYGVNAATTVRIDPPVEALHPAYTHCFQVSPRRDTEYTLTASDSTGHAVTKSITIRVVP